MTSCSASFCFLTKKYDEREQLVRGDHLVLGAELDRRIEQGIDGVDGAAVVAAIVGGAPLIERVLGVARRRGERGRRRRARARRRARRATIARRRAHSRGALAQRHVLHALIVGAQLDAHGLRREAGRRHSDGHALLAVGHLGNGDVDRLARAQDAALDHDVGVLGLGACTVRRAGFQRRRAARRPAGSSSSMSTSFGKQ